MKMLRGTQLGTAALAFLCAISFPLVGAEGEIWRRDGPALRPRWVSTISERRPNGYATPSDLFPANCRIKRLLELPVTLHSASEHDHQNLVSCMENYFLTWIADEDCSTVTKTATAFRDCVDVSFIEL